MFEFLEVENNEHKSQINYQDVIKDIPENQRLAISDLRIINPSAKALKAISKKILDKYGIIPLFTLIPGNKPILPKHLQKEYWGSIDGKKNLTIYVAMTEPFDIQPLNIIRTVTGYNVVSIPLQMQAAQKFLNSDYEKAVYGELPVEAASIYRDILKSLQQNIFVILIFLFILAGLLAVKFYIKT